MIRCSAFSAAFQSQGMLGQQRLHLPWRACPACSANRQHDLRSPRSASSAPRYANAVSRHLACANTGASRPRSSP